MLERQQHGDEEDPGEAGGPHQEIEQRRDGRHLRRRDPEVLGVGREQAEVGGVRGHQVDDLARGVEGAVG